MKRNICVIPARTASGRFPGKPLEPLLGLPLMLHVFEQCRLCEQLDRIVIATCDEEIGLAGQAYGAEGIMTSDTHARALDRVAEAVTLCGQNVDDDDLVVCVQGDEPMLRPDMIDAVVAPFEEDPSTRGTVLAMDIVDEEIFQNINTVKIIHNLNGDVLYTSRQPVPYCKEFSVDLGAKRIYGIFAFRWSFLIWFAELPESPLEQTESCDSNRICDNGGGQRIAKYPHIPSFSVDSLADLKKVEAFIKQDAYWGKY